MTFRNLAALPAGKLRPIFLHCRKSTTEQDPVTGFRRNPEQVTVALDAVARFVGAMKVEPARISVISPCPANVAEIKQQLKGRKYEHIRGMPSPSTFDSFQGQENDIIVIVTGTTAVSGPGFTVDPARLNVAMTRPRSGLIIVGDINTAGQLVDGDGKPLALAVNKGDKSFAFIDAEGNKCTRKAPALRAVLATLVRERRVVVAQ